VTGELPVLREEIAGRRAGLARGFREAPRAGDEFGGVRVVRDTWKHAA
jgi:hypothetical protein